MFSFYDCLNVCDNCWFIMSVSCSELSTDCNIYRYILRDISGVVTGYYQQHNDNHSPEDGSRGNCRNVVCTKYVLDKLIHQTILVKFFTFCTFQHKGLKVTEAGKKYVMRSFLSFVFQTGVLRFDSRRGGGNFSLHRRTQNGSGSDSASYPMDPGELYPRGKAVVA